VPSVFVAAASRSAPDFRGTHAIARLAFFLLPRPHTVMRILLSLSGVMMLAAPVVRGASSLIAPAQNAGTSLWLSEPSGLLVMGVGFVLLANQLHRKKS